MTAPDPTPSGALHPEVSHAAPPSRRLEVIAAVVALVVALGARLLTGTIETRVDSGGVAPQWWPGVLSLAAIAVAAGMLGVALFGRPVEREGLETATRTGWERVGATLLATAAFVALWVNIDFRVAAPLYLAGLLALYGGRGLKALLLYPVAMTGFIYLLFRVVLRVPL